MTASYVTEDRSCTLWLEFISGSSWCVIPSFLSVNMQKCETADCISSSTSWMHLLINETTLELINSLCKTLAVYYSAQKNMFFVDGPITPSSVTTASEGARFSMFRIRILNCFMIWGSRYFSQIQFRFGNWFIIMHIFHLLDRIQYFSWITPGLQESDF